ncbi:protein kinase domain-containing protein [Mitosporidium daphniae]|uniref:Protein kinase domain-containing protein n=1 Tax=Mitosporidium daphniae TaxID=1485682 RepID=A0A098VNK1_9MICR|nr:protein kinase domain-containing protein [Mitosporidium daphniae]KGG50540.1 protein kinase domain-containing protein [Mitosporidium daphniae]|eukprot:XP_013236983.1 protein kinase domain-containing protein [Mitosporidium daphniae]
MNTHSGIPLLMRYPEFLSKYSLLPKKVIGKGTFGSIHLASSKCDPSKLFAVKIFNKCRSKAAAEAYFTHLSSEFLIGVSLHHKNIVETYELVRYGPTWLEIMEYCKGGDLFESIQKKRLSQKVADFFFTELLSGIHYLHSLGIAHCDLKPENILISSDNHVKIADFGASCHFSILDKDCIQQGVHSIEEELCRGVCGSLPYTAPEILTMGPYDPAPVDIWSLGIIYFVMIFHKIPWHEASAQKDEKYLTQREKFDPISRLPTPMAKILCKMLEPHPASRITINELIGNTYIQNLNFD